MQKCGSAFYRRKIEKGHNGLFLLLRGTIIMKEHKEKLSAAYANEHDTKLFPLRDFCCVIRIISGSAFKSSV